MCQKNRYIYYLIGSPKREKIDRGNGSMYKIL